MTFHEQLKKLGACQPALDWVGEQTIEQAWGGCANSDWMIWLIATSGLPRPSVIKIACDCARLVLHLAPAGEDGPRLAIEAAEKWLAEPTPENSSAAGRSADAIISYQNHYAIHRAAAYRMEDYQAAAYYAAASAAGYFGADYAAGSAARYAANAGACEIDVCAVIRKHVTADMIREAM